MRKTLVKEFEKYSFQGVNNTSNFEHTIYKFSDKIGVSVVFGEGSRGLEAMKLGFYDDDNYTLLGEPEGYLTEQELYNFLNKICEENTP